jgi:acetyltransferase-like isoleucine patch superfamily enzyme
MRFFIKLFLNSSEKKVLHFISWRLAMINKFFNSFVKVNRDGSHMVHYTSTINGMKNIKFNGDDTQMLISLAVSGNCYFGIDNGYSLEIGEGTIWAPNVCIRTGNHGLINREEHICENIVIGKNCWLGFGSVILPGVVLGDNVTVGANSVVTKSFESNVVIGGIPAKVIKVVS